MKGHIPPDKIEEIKARAKILDIISEYVTLRKAGQNYVGLCPFHREKKPSFTVNPEKQIFYCFGCGEGGNAISFVMKINDMSFPEAVRQLAGKLGITIPARKISSAEKREASERERLCRVNKTAAGYFKGNLSSGRGVNAREYLNKRGIDDSVVQRFNLGYAPDGWRYLNDYFSERGIPLGLVQRAGLIIRKEEGQRYYDRFRNRVIFPIEDLNGDIIAFGGRLIGDGEPKYLNSPESPVYVKGRTLYGLNQAKSEIRKKNEALIVEGYLDLLSLWSHGITNVVATLGTALTRDQIELIRRFTRNVSIIFDPDEAGRAATERSLKLFLEEEMHARVVMLPGGDDPDDYVREFGGNALRQAVDRSPSVVDYYIDEIMGAEKTLEGTLDSVKESISFLGNISDPIQRNLFIKRVSERIHIDEGLLKGEVKRARSRREKIPRNEVTFRGSKAKRVDSVDSVELGLISMIMEYPDRISIVEREEIFECFFDTQLKEVGRKFIDSCQRGDVKDITDVIGSLHDGAVKDRLLKLTVSEKPYSEDIIDRILSDTVRKIKLRWYKKRRKMLQTQLAEAQKMGDIALCDRLIEEKERLLNEEKTYKDRMI